MSETVHYTGNLTPTGKTFQEFAPSADDIYDLYPHAVEIDGQIFTVEMEDKDPYDDIFKASKNEDGSIDFEVKYYNGGCGFYEAIEQAIKSLPQPEGK